MRFANPLLFLVTALVASGCASSSSSREPAPAAPLLTVGVEHFPGTTLTGALPDSEWEQSADGDPWAVDFTAAYVDARPAGEGQPLSSLARYVFVDRDDEPLRARAELALGITRLDASSPLLGSAWETNTLAALWAGTTTGLHTARSKRLDAAWDELEVSVSRRSEDPERAELAIILSGLVQPRVDETDPELEGAPPPSPVLQSEHVVLDELLRPDEEPLRLFVPAPREDAPAGGFVLDVVLSAQASLTGDGELETAAEYGRTSLAAAQEEARERALGAAPSDDFSFERSRALQALERRTLQRPTLVFLADATGAALTGDVALFAHEEDLADYLATVRARLEERASAGDSASAFGWFLEQTCYAWLATRSEDEGGGLSPELQSALVRRAGALGRYPDLVVESVAESADSDMLEQRFTLENRILLEDSHPSVRVRAFEWLQTRGEAPAGYDPLAERDARRAALAAAEAPPEEDGGTGEENGRANEQATDQDGRP